MEAIKPTTSNAPVIRQKIFATLVSLHPNPRIDVESLTHDIFIEAWSRGIPVTHQYIRHRLINAYHSTRIYARVVEESATASKESVDYELNTSEARTKLEAILPLAALAPFEVQVLFHTFYKSQSYAQTATTLNVSENRVKETLYATIQKLKAAGRVYDAAQERKESTK